jgi:transcriptional regulator with XRE-family HTH domain
MDVGKEIRRLREARGWSQAKLAGASGMGTSGISQIETGARNPSAATLSKIAEALGVEVRDLFPLDQAPLPDLEDERHKDREAAAAQDAIVFARRFVRLHENLNEIRDRLDWYRETWEKRLASGDRDKAAMEEAGRAIRAFWPAVVTAAEAEWAENNRIGMQPEGIEENSVLLPAMDRFQALCDRVNSIYREMSEAADASNVYVFPQREAS